MADIFGTIYNDYLYGGDEYDFIYGLDGDDYIDAGAGNANITAGPGSDIIDFGNVESGFANLFHWDLDSGIDAILDIDGNFASINSTSGYDQIWDIQRLFLLTDGIFIGGTEYNDSFYIEHTEYLDGQLILLPGDGVDSFYVAGDEGQMSNTRLMFMEAYDQGVIIDLSLDEGQIINDGYGNIETISGPGYIRQFFLTNQSDWFIGGDGDERIRSFSGDDYIDGGEGVDRIDLGTDQFSSVVVNLDEGWATGLFTMWEGEDPVNFNYTLLNIENVWTANWDDHITGSQADNTFRGRGGNDTMFGLGGDDTLRGDDGDDHLFGGDGADELIAGGGNDILNGGADADRFVFGLFDDTNVIEDFERGTDLIVLRDTGLGFDDLAITYQLIVNGRNVPTEHLPAKVIELVGKKLELIADVSFGETHVTAPLDGGGLLTIDDFNFV